MLYEHSIHHYTLWPFRHRYSKIQPHLKKRLGGATFKGHNLTNTDRDVNQNYIDKNLQLINMHSNVLF